MQVEGADEVRDALRRMTPETKKRLRPKLITWAEQVVAQVKPLVPTGLLDPYPGLLRDTVRIVRPTISVTKQKLVVSVVAGGAAVLGNIRIGGRRGDYNYAVKQHEDLTLRHDEGGPKFVERPFIAAAPQVPDLVLDALDEANN